ncbi:MAG: hypothetical protein NT026_01700 [Candidatus Staskawiczbacteria bacterium]|nr:hypothetical protein [Candidatus Staskawiczbacteria bacterium]
MPRKIYDIKPPKLAKEVGDGIKEFLGEDKKSRSRKVEKPRARARKEERSLRPLLFAVIFVIVFGAVVYLYFKLPKADIQIWPKVDTLSFKQVVMADKSADAVDLDKFVIPAKYFEVSKTISQDFPATGNANNEGQASGTITVYNKYDPATPLTLKAGTHFLSDSGKLFTALQKIVVPAATKSGGKIVPGSVDVKIQAVEGGENYNIAPSNFSIPGLKGTAYYYSVYGVSKSAMSGGYAGKVKKVTDDDIQGAKDALTKKAADEAAAELKSQIPSDYILLDNAISSENVDGSTQTKPGTVADNFTYQATVKATALAFKKADAEKFAKDYLISQLSQGKTLLDSSFKVNYSAGTVDISGGKETLSLDFSSGTYQDIDKLSVATSLTGKNYAQINETISNLLGDQVSKVQINFWPFWVTSAPNSQKAVEVEVKF